MMLGNVRDRRNGAGRWEGAIECSPPTPPFSFTLLKKEEKNKRRITGNVEHFVRSNMRETAAEEDDRHNNQTRSKYRHVGIIRLYCTNKAPTRSLPLAWITMTEEESIALLLSCLQPRVHFRWWWCRGFSHLTEEFLAPHIKDQRSASALT